MNIKKILVLIVLTVLISCKHTQPHSHCFGEYVDTGLRFKVEDAEGNNLLGNKINPDSIKIYYLYEDGCVEFYYSMSSDNHRGFGIQNDIIGVALRTNKMHSHGDNYYNIPFADREMYIEWNSQDTDTIFTTFLKMVSTTDEPLPSGYCEFDVYDKVYYNGKLIVSSWEDNQEKMSQGIYPTIIKE